MRCSRVQSPRKLHVRRLLLTFGRVTRPLRGRSGVAMRLGTEPPGTVRPNRISSSGLSRPNRFKLDQRPRPVAVGQRCTTLNCNPNCNPQIRRSGWIVQDRLLWSLRRADIPQLSVRDASCPTAWQQCWLQSRRPGADPRPSAFQAGHMPSWRGSCERCSLSPVAAGSRWPLLLLSPLLSSARRDRAWLPSPPGCGPCAPPLPPSD